MTWVLILTLVGPWNDSGTALLQVPGFHSRAECLAAGNSWLRQIRTESVQFKHHQRGQALCVQQGSARG